MDERGPPAQNVLKRGFGATQSGQDRIARQGFDVFAAPRRKEKKKTSSSTFDDVYQSMSWGVQQPKLTFRPRRRRL